MKIKRPGLALSALLSAFAFAACDTGTNVNRVANTNGNTAVVVNNNANATVTNTNATSSYNANITREEYDRDRARYADDAKRAGSTIGQGASDGWIWTKTRAALTTTDDLRDSTINVDVTNDVITLRGTVANAAQKAKAVQVAKTIEGQKGIKDELKVAANDSLINTNTNSAVNVNTNRK